MPERLSYQPEQPKPTKRDFREFERAARRVVLPRRDGILKKSGTAQIPLAEFDAGDGTMLVQTVNNRLRKSTVVQIVSPVPSRMHENNEVYPSTGILIKRGDRLLPDQIHTITSEYVKEDSGFLQNVYPYALPHMQGEASQADVRGMTEVLKKLANVQKRLPTEKSAQEVSDDTEYRALVNEKVDALFAVSTSDTGRGFPSDFATMTSYIKTQVEGDVAQERAGVPGIERQLDVYRKQAIGVVSENANGRFGIYVTRDGRQVHVRVDGESRVFISEHFPRDEGQSDKHESSLLRIIGADRIFSTVTESEKPEISPELVGVSLPKGSSGASLDASEREKVVELLEELTDDITFSKQVEEEGRKLLHAAESRGILREYDGVATAQFFPETSEGTNTFISARRKDDGSLLEMSVEQWAPPNPEHPDRIDANVLYIDPAWPTTAKRSMVHKMGGLERDMAWGEVGFTPQLKLELYEAPATRAAYSVKPEQREQILASLSALH